MPASEFEEGSPHCLCCGDLMWECDCEEPCLGCDACVLHCECDDAWVNNG